MKHIAPVLLRSFHSSWLSPPGWGGCRKSFASIGLRKQSSLNSCNQRRYGQIRANKWVMVSSLGLNEIGPAGRPAYRGFVLCFYYIRLGKTNCRFCRIYFCGYKYLFLNGLLGFGELVLRFSVLTVFWSFGFSSSVVGARQKQISCRV